MARRARSARGRRHSEHAVRIPVDVGAGPVDAMLIAAIGFAVICPPRNTRRRRIWIARSESRPSGAGPLKRRGADLSQSDVDDEQFGGSGRVDVQSALADHARRIVRP